MTGKITRRGVLTLAGSAAVAGLGYPMKSAPSPESPGPQASSSLPAPADAPFDTVVVLMMENRSFDHVLGWLPGANGRQAGLTYVDKDGYALTRPGHSDRIFRAAPMRTRTTLGPVWRSNTPTGAATDSCRPPRPATDFPSATIARMNCQSSALWPRATRPSITTSVR